MTKPSGTHHCHALAHVGVGHTEVRLIQSLLKDEVDAALEPLLCVNVEVQDLCDEGLELLGGELVQDAGHLLEQGLVRGRGFIRYPLWSGEICGS